MLAILGSRPSSTVISCSRVAPADMIFSVGDLISYSSRHVTLRPGDLILTGTPEGVGFGRKPRIYMKPGATVTVSVEGVCSITNPIVDSSCTAAGGNTTRRTANG